jgi:hypothetical protein
VINPQAVSLIAAKRAAHTIVLTPVAAAVRKPTGSQRVCDSFDLGWCALVGNLNLTEFVFEQPVQYWIQGI